MRNDIDKLIGKIDNLDAVIVQGLNLYEAVITHFISQNNMKRQDIHIHGNVTIVLNPMYIQKSNFEDIINIESKNLFELEKSEKAKSYDATTAKIQMIVSKGIQRLNELRGEE